MSKDMLSGMIWWVNGLSTNKEFAYSLFPCLQYQLKVFIGWLIFPNLSDLIDVFLSYFRDRVKVCDRG